MNRRKLVRVEFPVFKRGNETPRVNKVVDFHGVARRGYPRRLNKGRLEAAKEAGGASDDGSVRSVQGGESDEAAHGGHGRVGSGDWRRDGRDLDGFQVVERKEDHPNGVPAEVTEGAQWFDVGLEADLGGSVGDGHAKGSLDVDDFTKLGILNVGSDRLGAWVVNPVCCVEKDQVSGSDTTRAKQHERGEIEQGEEPINRER